MSKKGRQRSGVGRAVDKLQDTIEGFAGRIAAGSVSKASEFVEHAAMSDRYEIQAANMALLRSSSDEVRSMAEAMLHDHRTSTHQLEAALEMNETMGVPTPPDELDGRHTQMIEHLDSTPDDRFDTTYLEQQIQAHEEALALMRGYRDRGDNPQLQSFAAATAPVVERHLHHMRGLKVQKAH